MAGFSTSVANYSDGRAVTPHDTNALPNGVCRAIYVGGTGNIALELAQGAALTFTSVPVGILLVQARIIKSTSTTATNMIALY